MKELAVQGVTIVISSHILAELDELCDRVAIIEAGKVLAQGTTDEIRGAVTAAHTVTIRVLGGEEALHVAAQLVGAAGALVQVVDGRLQCEIVGGEEAAADLLAVLVGAGVRVTDFREDRGGLERLFLSVTEGIVR
jgi:ABC-2 type transport system ATP-binding protein